MCFYEICILVFVSEGLIVCLSNCNECACMCESYWACASLSKKEGQREREREREGGEAEEVVWQGIQLDACSSVFSQCSSFQFAKSLCQSLLQAATLTVSAYATYTFPYHLSNYCHHFNSYTLPMTAAHTNSSFKLKWRFASVMKLLH